MNVFKMVCIGIFVAGMGQSCSQLTKATDVITNPTPREVYARSYTNDTLIFPRWQQAFAMALRDSLKPKLPYVEQGRFFRESNFVYAYNLELNTGEIFHAKALTDIVNTQVFMDLYKTPSDTRSPHRLITQNELNQNSIIFTPKESGTYTIIVQPEIGANTPFVLKLYKTPLYDFPVSGKGNAAIQSFWGASRDGGRRSHKGVDIFAPKGTPVVAATDGWVSNTGNRGLGGKQVWMRSGLFGNSLYYAHLDSIAVNSGKRVKRGDTLGFVGNTGNARTTPPHLHFGIYKGGALDPLPFIYEGVAPKASSTGENAASSEVVVKAARANLRSAAHTLAKKIGEVKRRDTLQLLGRSMNWAHVRTATSKSAFIHKSLIEEI